MMNRKKKSFIKKKDAGKWLLLILGNTIISSIVGVLLPRLINLFAAWTKIGQKPVPEDGLTQILVATITFIIGIFFSLIIDIKETINKHPEELSKIINESINKELNETVSKTFVGQFPYSFTKDHRYSQSVLNFLNYYFNRLEEMSPSQHIAISFFLERKINNWINDLECNLKDGVELPIEEMLLLSESYLSCSSKSSKYTVIERIIRDWKTAWTDTFIKFIEKLNSSPDLKKIYISLISEEEISSKSELFKECIKFLKEHNFEVFVCYPKKLLDAISIDTEHLPYNTVEIFDNKRAFFYEAPLDGYRGGKKLKIHIIDLEKDRERLQLVENVIKYSAPIN